MRCPHCKTPLRMLFRPDECKHCGRPLKDEEGQEVREIDRDFEGLLSRLDAQSKERMKQGTVVCLGIAAVSLLGFLFPLIGGLVAMALAIQTIVWARMLICAPYARHFSLGRRIVTRWVSRFFVLSMAGAQVHGVIPAAPIIAAPLVFLATCGTAWWYHRFHLGREHRREPVTCLEKAILILAAIVFVVVTVLLVLLIRWMLSMAE